MSAADPREAMADPPRRRASLRAKVLLLLSVLVLGAGGLEVAARVRMAMRYGRATTDVYETRLDPASGLAIPVPGPAGPANINSLGFRGPEIPPKSTAIRLGFLGGSTTFCAEAGEDANTWPARVCAALDADPGDARFEYVNAALQGFGLSESAANLEHRLGPLDPDVVFIYHATNDIVRDTRARALAAGFDASWGDERSWLARISVAWDLIEKNARVAVRKRRAAEGAALLDVDESALAARFQERLEALIREAQARAPLVVVLTFSTRLRPEQSPQEQLLAATTSILYMPYMDPPRLLRIFAAYNDAIRRAAAATGALLVDAERAIPGDGEHFQDSVHLTAAGCARMAEVVAERLRGAPAFQALVEGRD